MVSPQSESWQEYILEVVYFMNYTMRETHLQANSSECIFYQRKPCTVSELPTELKGLKESPELTVQLKLFGT